ncbi:MAG: peptidylprolyl isomerase [Xanthomonadales bacterium]|jgi:peptidyl-prolyl cis-trans isomerase SurA|nr:peptidylprolyl isomerase [Xanthomonadales bacterium]
MLTPLRALCGALLFALSFAHAQPLDRIVALVEDEVVLASELDQAYANVRRQYTGRESQLPPEAVLKRQILDRLVLNRLQLQRAKNANIQVTDTEIDQAVGRVGASNNLSVAELRTRLAADGIDFADFRRNIAEELTMQRLRDRLVASRVEVSETEVDLAMAQDRVKQGEVRLASILVALPEEPDAAAVETARKKAEGVRELVSKGEMDFTAAAIRYSDAPRALETGGEIGWRRFDQIPAVFADVVAVLTPGEISPPVRTQNGFHLLTVTDRRAVQNINVTEFNARHIVVDVTELVSEQEARTEILRIREQIDGGADFAKLAREFSDETQSANLGGDMGWFDIDAYGTTYAETLSRLADGEISMPVRTERGWHLIQRMKTREQDRTEEFVRNQARDAIRSRKLEEAYDAFLRQLRNESFIELKLERAS